MKKKIILRNKQTVCIRLLMHHFRSICFSPFFFSPFFFSGFLFAAHHGSLKRMLARANAAGARRSIDGMRGVMNFRYRPSCVASATLHVMSEMEYIDQWNQRHRKPVVRCPPKFALAKRQTCSTRGGRDGTALFKHRSWSHSCNTKLHEISNVLSCFQLR